MWIGWLAENWLKIAIPLLAFIATAVVGFWLRGVGYRYYNRWTARVKWQENKIISETVRGPFLHWFLILGAYIAVVLSPLPDGYKELSGKILGTLFMISLAWVIAIISEKLIRLYLDRLKVIESTIIITTNVIRVTIVVVAALIVLEIWGVPTNPILLVLAIGLFVAALAFRDTIPSFFTGMQMINREQIKQGDFIKLESGEAGEVSNITWQHTQIKSLDGNLILIPNSKLARTTVTNYGHPVKKSASPFHFYTRLLLRELTGLKACNLSEMASTLREVPDSVVYYHTHHFLEEQLYLTPEPANDFARWVSSTLNSDILGERLASIDTFSYPTIGALKMRLIGVLDDYLLSNPEGRKVPEGEEFYFIRSVSLILPTPYIAHDLREFVESMKKATLDSIYFHVFEARLRLQKGNNDFSIWLADSLGENELADKIAQIDPYVFTLENFKRRIIQLIEERIT